MKVQHIDGIAVRLKEQFDLDFIRQYGAVFRVFDAQSSGNLCFGVEKAGKKYFVKFAGAKTINDHDLPVEDALARLKAAVPKYKEMVYPALVRLIDAAETGGGYALLFDWADGESFGEKNYSLREKFMSLPISERMKVFEEVLSFHAHVARCGYVAVDFNENSILYDFDNGSVTICDIDFYAKQSYMNGIGRAIGEENFMSPEEYRPAGLIDEITNVYTMGAAAFFLLANSGRSPEKWPLNMQSYDVIRKAVSEERRKRQQSIEQLIVEWKAAIALN